MQTTIVLSLTMLLTAVSASEVCLDERDDAYTFFAKAETSTDIYVIESTDIFDHSGRIHKSLKNSGAFVFEKNPSSKCGWMTNLNYDWEYYNRVMYKGNTSVEMDAFAKIANDATAKSVVLNIVRYIVGAIFIISAASVVFTIICAFVMVIKNAVVGCMNMDFKRIKDAIIKSVNRRYEPVKVVDPQTPMVDYKAINPIGLV